MYMETQLILYLLHQSTIAKVTSKVNYFSPETGGLWHQTAIDFIMINSSLPPLTSASKENHTALPRKIATYPQSMDLLNKKPVLRIRTASGAIFGYLWANWESNGNLKCIMTDFFFQSLKNWSLNIWKHQRRKRTLEGGKKKKRKGDASDIPSSFKGRKKLEARVQK